MRIGYNVKRLSDLMNAGRIAKELARHDHWTREELKQFQHQELSRLVKYAVKYSPFYKRLYAGISLDELPKLDQLPVIDKRIMMDNFDQFVTNPQLKLADLQKHLATISRDEYYLNKYRVLTTAGSSGLVGVFVQNRSEWSTGIAAQIRAGQYAGIRAQFPNRLKSSVIISSNPRHSSWRSMATTNIGQIILQQLYATEPIDTLAAKLNDFQPQTLSGYTSILALLATEQLEGRLRIRPRHIQVSAEVFTADMAQKMGKAWGVKPFNVYGATEVMVIGATCTNYKGMHAFEDLAIIEVVDEHNKPVPDGTRGHKILITNLYNYTQPIIRYELSDMITMSTEVCPCGRPFRLIRDIEGRSDDILFLEGTGSKSVPVHPIHFHSLLGQFDQIREYQVVYEDGGLHVYLVVSGTEDKQVFARDVENKLRTQLQSLGAKCPPIQIHFVERLQRDPKQMGKLKLVKIVKKN